MLQFALSVGLGEFLCEELCYVYWHCLSVKEVHKSLRDCLPGLGAGADSVVLLQSTMLCTGAVSMLDIIYTNQVESCVLC